MTHWPGVILGHRSRLDLPDGLKAVTLLEGNTPLIEMPRLADLLSAKSFFVKFEGLNPTGSFKDRGMTVAMSEAANRGARAVLCASTGNTAASAAAYAARAGLACFVLIPQGKVASGKLAGAMAYGARILQIEGSFDAALHLARELALEMQLAIVNSINPYRLEGQKTAAFEVLDALGRPPHWLALPVGNAGNISSYWMGFQEDERVSRRSGPRLLGVQAAGAAPLVRGEPVAHPETVATAIRIGHPARGEQALAAARESGGRIVAAPDAEILAAQGLLASEGVWVEPASAAGLAGLLGELDAGRLNLQGKTVVCICTGHGLKDPDAITRSAPEPEVLPADLEALRARIHP